MTQQTWEDWLAAVRAEHDTSGRQWPISPQDDPQAYGALFVQGVRPDTVRKLAERLGDGEAGT